MHRGPLIRDGLSLQTLELPDQASRLAWLAQTIPQLKGTGIVYVLTKRDADQVADWLVENGINAKPYYSGVIDPDYEDSDQSRQYLEDALLNNEIDVLVATTALGMGYDKPDLAFVIHFQAPGSIVAYYQQVGRAGRGIDSSIGVLLSGREDHDIHEYFRNSAFPSEDEVNQILEALDNADGLKVRDLEEHSNVSNRQIEKVLKMLSIENPAPIFKDGSYWYRTANPFTMDHERIAHLTQQRETEWQEVQDYMATDTCLMTYLRNALDDDNQQPCGCCANCLGHAVVDIVIEGDTAHQAAVFLKQAEAPIKPNVQVAAGAFETYGFRGNLPPCWRAQEGRVLSRWGDAGWGHMVAEDKHNDHFRDELVEATAKMIRERWNPEEYPEWVCCVPSRNHPELVPSFAQRLAAALSLPFVDVISKTRDNELQKLQQNRYRRCRNLDGAFEVTQPHTGPVLLVDDIVDSGWTFTVVAALLQQAGSGKVYPVALASTSTGD